MIFVKLEDLDLILHVVVLGLASSSLTTSLVDEVDGVVALFLEGEDLIFGVL